MEKTIKDLFEKRVESKAARDCDVYSEIHEFNWVMIDYGDYFTFEKSENEKEISRTDSLITELFVYLYPTLGGSASDTLSSLAGSASRELGLVLTIDESGHEKIYDQIKKTALNVERAIKNLVELGLDLTKFLPLY